MVLASCFSVRYRYSYGDAPSGKGSLARLQLSGRESDLDAARTVSEKEGEDAVSGRWN